MEVKASQGELNSAEGCGQSQLIMSRSTVRSQMLVDKGQSMEVKASQGELNSAEVKVSLWG